MIAHRYVAILELLASNSGKVVSKDAVFAAGRDAAVSDNSVTQAISALRKVLGAQPDGAPYIKNDDRFTSTDVTFLWAVSAANAVK